MLGMTSRGEHTAAAASGGAGGRRRAGDGTSFKSSTGTRSSLIMSIRSTQILEVADEDDGGDEYDDGIRGASSTHGYGGGEGDDGASTAGRDPFRGMNTYHLSYLLGVSAGAKAAAEGPIGGQSTDESAWEGRGKTSRAHSGGGAAGGRGGRRSNAPIEPQPPPQFSHQGATGAGDDVYMLGFRHGRTHGRPAPGSSTAYDDVDVEAGEGLTLEERMQRLRDDNAPRYSEVETIWDSPSCCEQFLLDYCICRGVTEYICCSSGILCIRRDVIDAILVILCFFGSIIGMLIAMSYFHIF